MDTRLQLPFSVRMTLAILLTGVATVALEAARSWLTTPTVALLYLLPVGLAAAFWGLGPGLAAAACAFFGFNFFFLPPYHTFHVLRPEDILSLLVFLVVAVVISQLLGRAQASLAEARMRAHEATHLHEMTLALVGATDPYTVARILANQVQTTFAADRLRVVVLPGEAGARLEVVLPADASLPGRRPDAAVPIQGMRSLMGDISLWRDGGLLTPEEDRLLRTFIRESALALERSRLAEAESRARVLEQSDTLKSALLSSVSHELRTPLATIKASVTSLRGGAVEWDSEARGELLQAIEEETDHLNQLVGNLLDMSRIEAGALRPQRSWNLLGEVVQSVLGRMKATTRQHVITVDLPEDLPLVPLDFVQIEQVFANLISNSVKYSPAGTRIRIRARLLEDKWVLAEVTNEGPPIPPGFLERMFDKFTRLPGDDRVMGTGLGLSICRGIVKAHGGRIWAENQPGSVAFRFTLPLVLEGLPAPAGEKP